MAEAAPKAKGKSTLGLILSVVVLTLVAGGGGALIGRQIVAAARAAAAPAIKAAAAAEAPSTMTVRELSPIITNLAAPEGAWVRLQTAIVYDKADAAQMDIMASKIVDDSLSYIKTLTMAQLQGASGLQHLREDLNERAAVRSDGHVKEVMIEMMVVQ